MPDQQWRRLLSVRSFDKDHMMTGGDVVDGKDLIARAETYFNDDKVIYLHVHNAKPGCFAVRIDRGTQQV